MDYKEQIQYLRYLGQQSQHINASAFSGAARSISDLLVRSETAEAERDRLKEKLGLASAALKAKVAEIPDTTEDDLRKAEIEAAVEWATHGLEDKLQETEGRCKRLNEARKKANEACAKWECRAKKAEKEIANCREKNAGLALALLTEQSPNSDCLGDQEWQVVKNRVKEAEAWAVKAEGDTCSAIKSLESCMVRLSIYGHEPCDICAKANQTPCEVCEPRWAGQKEE